MKFQIFSRLTWRGKRWFFRIVAKNGEPVAQSEGYQNRGDCVATAHAIRRDCFNAVIENLG